MSFICADTEDDSEELLAAGKSGFGKRVTQIAALTDGNESYYSKGDVKGFLKWIECRKERHIYFHNLQYDLGNLFGRELDCFDATLVGGRIIKATWRNKIFVDSFNLWPMSAAKIGEAFGLKKLKRDSTSHKYVFRDVEIIKAAVQFVWDFCKAIGLETPPPTLGGLCVKFWRYLGGDNCHDSSELSRQALFGGRVELFKERNDCNRICWTDINSLYPFCMMRDFPGQLEDCGTQLADHGVATVTVKVPESELCVLPFRNKDGRILYPWGKFTGTWTIAEINAAVADGARVEKVHACEGTTETMQPYQEFVSRLYRSRLASKTDAEKLFFKLLMNNLYGRLGTSGVIGRTVWQTDKNKFDGVAYGEKVLCSYTMPLSAETNWSHAAHVTAYGRLELLKYLKKVGASNLIYCDTDSTIFDCPSKRIPFAVGKELGQMKLEGWEKHCETYAPKLYHIGDTYKAKGVPKRLAQTFIETGRAEFDLPFKIREAIRFYDRSNKRRLSVWRRVEKVRHGKYDKKILDGNRYLPCKISAVAPD